MRLASFQRIAELALILAAFACLALAGARVAANLSFTTPLQLVTSGAEQEALESIWRCVHGQAVYTDPHAIPYTASCFNWLFYAVYGSIAGEVMRLFHLGDAWMPTVCRLLTLGFAIMGAAIFAGLLRGLGAVHTHIALALGIIAFFNPLCGFWIITARPDLAAVTLELLGVALFFRHLRDGKLRWMVLAALALVSAWAFKQTSVSAMAGIAVTLLLLQRGRALAMLAVIWQVGVAATVMVLGPVYRQALFLGQLHAGFSGWWALHHLALASLKMPIIVVSVVGAIWTWRRNADDPVRLATRLILVITLGWELLLGTKAGAGDYYFIPLGVWSVLWLSLRMRMTVKDERLVPSSVARRSTATDCILRASSPAAPVRWKCPEFIFDLAVVVAAALILIDVSLIFTGRQGAIHCRDPRQSYEHLANYLATRPGPVFVEDTYGDLPWISPTSPHFVVAYNNGPDQHAGVPFERGGWQGLLKQGYFSTVVTEAGSDAVSAIIPDRYRFVRAEAGWRYFERK
jgi:hypothetical protein